MTSEINSSNEPALNARGEAGSAFCTIVAVNYIAHARSLCESLRQLHPGVARYVLFIDGFRDVLNPGGEPFEAIALEQIGLPDPARLCFKYDVVELATAVKPQLLRFLFETHHFSKIVYLDPDILVLSALQGIFDSLDAYNLILTPHIDTEFPDDGHRPDTAIPLTYGLFNLGFLALRKSPECWRFLDWWGAKLEHNCTRDGSSVYYVDQKVMDLVPFLFKGVLIERGAGYNVAYWNIHSRWVRLENGQWRCNDVPLYFFHFSAFDPEHPQSLSKETTRPLQESNRDVPKLLDLYRELLLKNGYETAHRRPYGHGKFPTGEDICYRTRSFYRVSPKVQDEETNPFDSKRLMSRNRSERFLQKNPKVNTIITLSRQIYGILRRRFPV